MRSGRIAIAAAAARPRRSIFVSWPRQADLRAFDSGAMARLETATWRDYYEKRYGALFHRLYELSRTAVRLLAARQPSHCALRRKSRQGVPADPLARRGRADLWQEPGRPFDNSVRY